MNKEEFHIKMLKESKKPDNQFIEVINEVMRKAHTIAKDKGFYHNITQCLDNAQDNPKLYRHIRTLFISSSIALIQSEASEALEAVRHNFPKSDALPGMDNFTEELADIIIRVFDTAKYLNLKLPETILAKMEYNDKRKPLHGKTI